MVRRGTESTEPGTLGADAGASASETGSLTHAARGQRIDRFLVLGLLGKGAMGVVVEAHDEHLDRTVALKLLHHEASQRHRDRLMREAQALARLSHPNVVQVYDVGTMGEQMYIAMELVRGQTLARQAFGSWRETVRVYLEAARGLAAAHAKGLIHRDFKPENCMVGEDGRVRVVDFGLARDVTATTSETKLDEQRKRPSSSTIRVLDQRITRDGTILGTLAYMAPEQLRGETADASSDQYAFFVALYEALVGHRPHTGRTPVEVMTSMLEKRTTIPASAPVPRRLRRALLRGLARQPQERWPSMDVVVTELESIVRRRAWRSALVTLGLGAIVGGGFTLFSATPTPCPSPEVMQDDLWDRDAQRGIADAFARLYPDGEAVLLPRIVDRFGDYAGRWAEMAHRSCVATFVEHRQSEELFERRAQCLERRRNRLELAIDALVAAPDGHALVQRGILAFKLPMLDECRDPAAPENHSVAGSDSTDENRAVIDRLIDQAETLRESGEYPQALAVAGSAVAQTRTTEDPRLRARALECQGRIQAEAGSMREAQPILQEAIMEATKGVDHATAARAWLSLLYATTLVDDLNVAENWLLPTRATVEATDDDLLRAWLANSHGILAAESGRPIEARQHLEHALEVKRKVLGDEHVDVGIAWLNLGIMLTNTAEYSAAREPMARAQEIFEGTVGPTHPLAANALGVRCFVGWRLGGDVESALELCQLALERFRATPGSPMWEARTKYDTAQVLWALGRSTDSLLLAREARRLAEQEYPALTQEIDVWLRDHEAKAHPDRGQPR